MLESTSWISVRWGHLVQPFTLLWLPDKQADPRSGTEIWEKARPTRCAQCQRHQEGTKLASTLYGKLHATAKFYFKDIFNQKKQKRQMSFSSDKDEREKKKDTDHSTLKSKIRTKCRWQQQQHFKKRTVCLHFLTDERLSVWLCSFSIWFPSLIY